MSVKKVIPSATIILVRGHEDELQVYLLRRHSKSSFMPGNYVFPGGMVDVGDQDQKFWIQHVDLNAHELNDRFGGNFSQADALAFGVAAIRETYEEAGVRLWEIQEGEMETALRLDQQRTQHDLDVKWMKARAQSGKWRLSFSRLFRWAHWITPMAMKRRFNTRFYVAVIPENQICIPDNRETTHGLWISPAKALAESRAGKIPLGPPTLTTLHELLRYPNMDALLVNLPKLSWGNPMMPRLITSAKNALFLMPWDPDYDADQFDLDFNEMPERVLPIGTDFSRLWEHQGICRPVSVDPPIS